MRIGSEGQQPKVVYGWYDNGLWMLSRFDRTVKGRRPISLFDTREELESEVSARGLTVKWLD